MIPETFFDFCSGIGAGRLGLEQCGLTCVGHSDTSRLADTTYRLLHNAAKDKNFGNLKRLNGVNLPQYDVLIAGFPCQTFSVIGRKEGFSDDRGQIIFHLARILEFWQYAGTQVITKELAIAYKENLLSNEYAVRSVKATPHNCKVIEKMI